jgi:hypothetical protein
MIQLNLVISIYTGLRVICLYIRVYFILRYNIPIRNKRERKVYAYVVESGYNHRPFYKHILFVPVYSI